MSAGETKGVTHVILHMGHVCQEGESIGDLALISLPAPDGQTFFHELSCLGELSLHPRQSPC